MPQISAEHTETGQATKAFVLVLASEAYGEEDFTYDTWEELQDGLGRLFREAQRCYQEDGVERDLIVRVPNNLALPENRVA